MEKVQKIHYDYSVGLNTPYWVKEIRSPKGTQLWYFNTPVELSFFFVFGIVVSLMIFFLRDIMQELRFLTMGATNVLWFFLPYHVARLYTEYEPDEKKMHVFIRDVIRYMIKFGINKQPIYNEMRVQPLMHKMAFEKTIL